jgi:hypothetical protein
MSRDSTIHVEFLSIGILGVCLGYLLSLPHSVSCECKSDGSAYGVQSMDGTWYFMLATHTLSQNEFACSFCLKVTALGKSLTFDGLLRSEGTIRDLIGAVERIFFSSARRLEGRPQ